MHHLPNKQEASHLTRPEHRLHFKNKVHVKLDVCAGEGIYHTLKYGKDVAIIYFPFYYSLSAIFSFGYHYYYQYYINIVYINITNYH